MENVRRTHPGWDTTDPEPFLAHRIISCAECVCVCVCVRACVCEFYFCSFGTTQQHTLFCHRRLLLLLSLNVSLLLLSFCRLFITRHGPAKSGLFPCPKSKRHWPERNESRLAKDPERTTRPVSESGRFPTTHPGPKPAPAT